MPRKNKKPPTRSKGDSATVELRILEIVQIILDGAKNWDIYAYVSQKTADAQKPQAPPSPWRMRRALSERTVKRYIEQARKRIVDSCIKQDVNVLENHLAMRESLYARAVNSGDLSNALAVLRDMDTLLDLYPAKKVKSEQSGHVSHSFDDIDDLAPADLDAERRRLEALLANPAPAGSGAGPP